jgi:hypothetical protein
VLRPGSELPVTSGCYAHYLGIERMKRSVEPVLVFRKGGYDALLLRAACCRGVPYPRHAVGEYSARNICTVWPAPMFRQVSHDVALLRAACLLASALPVAQAACCG